MSSPTVLASGESIFEENPNKEPGSETEGQSDLVRRPVVIESVTGESQMENFLFNSYPEKDIKYDVKILSNGNLSFVKRLLTEKEKKEEEKLLKICRRNQDSTEKKLSSTEISPETLSKPLNYSSDATTNSNYFSDTASAITSNNSTPNNSLCSSSVGSYFSGQSSGAVSTVSWTRSPTADSGADFGSSYSVDRDDELPKVKLSFNIEEPKKPKKFWRIFKKK